MLAFLLVQQLTCSGCGGHLPDTTAPDADGAYVAELPVRCHRCTAIGVQADAYHIPTVPQPQALRYPTRRK